MSEEEENLNSRPRHVMRKDRPWLLALTLADLACGLALVSGGSCLVLVYGARSPAVDTSERGPALVMDPLALAWPTYVLPGAFLAASGLALLAQAWALAVALWPDCGCGRCGGRCGGGRCCVFQRPRRELRDMAIDRGVVYERAEQQRPHSLSPGSSSSSDSAVVVVRTIATQTDEKQEEEKEEEKTPPPPPPPPPPATRKKAKKKRGRRMEDRSEDNEEFALFSESEGSDQEDGGFFRYLW